MRRLAVVLLLALTAAGVEAEEKPRDRAVVVGVNRPEGAPGAEPRFFSESDATDVAGAFEGMGYGVDLLLGTEATAKAVRERVEKAAGEVPAGGRLVFYFSGVGVERDEQQYLLTAGADPAGLQATALTMVDLRSAVEATSAPFVGVFLDAGRVDGVAEGQRQHLLSERMSQDLVLAPGGFSSFDDSAASDTIYACSPGQDAYESEGHGLLTRAFLEALTGAAKVGREVTIFEVERHVSRAVPQAAETLGVAQSPWMVRVGRHGGALGTPRPMTAPRREALVVGVSTFLHLPEGPGDLARCATDAQAVAAALEARGYHVTIRMGEQATREGILGAVSEAAGRLDPAGEFVFYYSGRGSLRGGDGVLLPADTRSDGTNHIAANELRWVLESLAVPRTLVFLDANSSQAMIRFPGSVVVHQGPQPPEASLFVSSSSHPGLSSSGGIRYLTSSRADEPALQDDADGHTRGVFTRFLLKALANPDHDWSDVARIVTEGVPMATRERQHPVWSPTLAKPRRSAASPDSLDGAAAATFYAAFDQPDPAALTLTMEPDVPEVRVGDQLRFQVRPRRGGHLVVLELGTSGKLHFLHPVIEVTAGLTLPIPEPKVGQGYRAEDPGTERIKAILFHSQAGAQTLSSSAPHTTAELIFEVRQEP